MLILYKITSCINTFTCYLRRRFFYLRSHFFYLRSRFLYMPSYLGSYDKTMCTICTTTIRQTRSANFITPTDTHRMIRPTLQHRNDDPRHFFWLLSFPSAGTTKKTTPTSPPPIFPKPTCYHHQSEVKQREAVQSRRTQQHRFNDVDLSSLSLQTPMSSWVNLPPRMMIEVLLQWILRQQ